MDLTILKWRKKTPLKAIANYFGVTTPIEVALVMNWRGLRGNWSVPTVQAKTFVWKKKVVLIINRLSQNKVTNTINPNQNCAQWGQIFQSIWLGSAYSLRKKRPKNNFQTQEGGRLLLIETLQVCTVAPAAFYLKLFFETPVALYHLLRNNSTTVFLKQIFWDKYCFLAFCFAPHGSDGGGRKMDCSEISSFIWLNARTLCNHRKWNRSY